MSLKNKVEVKIGGKEYTLVGIESFEYIHKVAKFIDNKLQEVMEVNSTLNTSMTAILASVNVADEYYKTLESNKEYEKQLELATEKVEVATIKMEELEVNNKLLNEEVESIKLHSDEITRTHALLKTEVEKKQNEIDNLKMEMEYLDKKNTELMIKLSDFEEKKTNKKSNGSGLKVYTNRK